MDNVVHVWSLLNGKPPYFLSPWYIRNDLKLQKKEAPTSRFKLNGSEWS